MFSLKSKIVCLFAFCFQLSLFSFAQGVVKKNIDYGNNPAAGKYAEVNGIKLYYEVYGKGMPLLMLHGNGGSIKAFENQIPFFSAYFKVIAVDSRLQGKSGGSPDTISYDLMADDFCKLLDYLRIDSAFVLGWSDGGINGLIMGNALFTENKMPGCFGRQHCP